MKIQFIQYILFSILFGFPDFINMFTILTLMVSLWILGMIICDYFTDPIIVDPYSINE